MADYYSLIADAVSRLPSKTDEARHALYERARTALQERSHTPNGATAKGTVVCYVRPVCWVGFRRVRSIRRLPRVSPKRQCKSASQSSRRHACPLAAIIYCGDSGPNLAGGEGMGWRSGPHSLSWRRERSRFYSQHDFDKLNIC
jgi:hypothetical protein